MDPSRSSSRRSSPALVMLPLCATAMLALIAGHRKRLRVQQDRVAGGGIARVADGQFARQRAQHFRREDIRHVAHALVAVDVAAVARGDAGAFLAAMLQRVEAQIGEVGGFGMAVDGEDAALFVEFVKQVRRTVVRHVRCQLTFQSVLPNLAEPIHGGIDPRHGSCDPIRNLLFIVTPMRSASTLCSRAICSTASGTAVETRMRDGPSWNRANSGRRSARDLNRRARCRSRRTRPAPPPGRHRSHRAPIPRGPALTISRIAACTRFS